MYKRNKKKEINIVSYGLQCVCGTVAVMVFLFCNGHTKKTKGATAIVAAIM